MLERREVLKLFLGLLLPDYSKFFTEEVIVPSLSQISKLEELENKIKIFKACNWYLYQCKLVFFDKQRNLWLKSPKILEIKRPNPDTLIIAAQEVIIKIPVQVSLIGFIDWNDNFVNQTSMFPTYLQLEDTLSLEYKLEI